MNWVTCALSPCSSRTRSAVPSVDVDHRADDGVAHLDLVGPVGRHGDGGEPLVGRDGRRHRGAPGGSGEPAQLLHVLPVTDQVLPGLELLRDLPRDGSGEDDRLLDREGAVGVQTGVDDERRCGALGVGGQREWPGEQAEREGAGDHHGPEPATDREGVGEHEVQSAITWLARGARPRKKPGPDLNPPAGQSLAEPSPKERRPWHRCRVTQQLWNPPPTAPSAPPGYGRPPGAPARVQPGLSVAWPSPSRPSAELASRSTDRRRTCPARVPGGRPGCCCSP